MVLRAFRFVLRAFRLRSFPPLPQNELMRFAVRGATGDATGNAGVADIDAGVSIVVGANPTAGLIVGFPRISATILLFISNPYLIVVPCGNMNRIGFVGSVIYTALLSVLDMVESIVASILGGPFHTNPGPGSRYGGVIFAVGDIPFSSNTRGDITTLYKGARCIQLL